MLDYVFAFGLVKPSSYSIKTSYICAFILIFKEDAGPVEGAPRGRGRGRGFRGGFRGGFSRGRGGFRGGRGKWWMNRVRLR